MRFYCTIAWRNIWRNSRRSMITAIAMALSVSMCMAMVAITDGFYEVFFDVMVSKRLGHVQIRHEDYAKSKSLYDTVLNSDQIIADIQKDERSSGVTGRLYSSVLVDGGSNSSGAQIQGVYPDFEASISTIQEQITEGRFLSSEPQKEILLGVSLYEELGVPLNEDVLLFTQASDGSMAYDEFTVVGVYKSGSTMSDLGMQAHITDLQDLLLLPEQVHEILVLSDVEENIETHWQQIANLPSISEQESQGRKLIVTPWWVSSPQTQEMMAFRDFGAFMFLGIIFFTAGFGILNTMLMSVFERTRELGVLKALGLRPSKMIVLIVIESILLSAIASVIGLMIGGLFDYYLVNYGIDMSGGTGEPLAMMGMNLDPVMKGVVNFNLLFFVPMLSVFVISVLASLWPAIRASRLNPVEAIRSE